MPCTFFFLRIFCFEVVAFRFSAANSAAIKHFRAGQKCVQKDNFVRKHLTAAAVAAVVSPEPTVLTAMNFRGSTTWSSRCCTMLLGLKRQPETLDTKRTEETKAPPQSIQLRGPQNSVV